MVWYSGKYLHANDSGQESGKRLAATQYSYRNLSGLVKRQHRQLHMAHLAMMGAFTTGETPLTGKSVRRRPFTAWH